MWARGREKTNSTCENKHRGVCMGPTGWHSHVLPYSALPGHAPDGHTRKAAPSAGPEHSAQLPTCFKYSSSKPTDWSQSIPPPDPPDPPGPPGPPPPPPPPPRFAALLRSFRLSFSASFSEVDQILICWEIDGPDALAKAKRSSEHETKQGAGRMEIARHLLSYGGGKRARTQKSYRGRNRRRTKRWKQGSWRISKSTPAGAR